MLNPLRHEWLIIRLLDRLHLRIWAILHFAFSLDLLHIYHRLPSADLLLKFLLVVGSDGCLGVFEGEEFALALDGICAACAYIILAFEKI